MKKVLIVMLVLLAVCSSFVFASCSSKVDINDPENLIGFDTELARAVTTKLGVAVSFQQIDWSLKETELNSKTIDAIWNGFTINEDRLEKFTFSQPYIVNKQVYVVKKGYTPTASSKYIAEGGSAGASYLESKNIEFIEAGAQKDCLTEILSGTSDCAVIDKVMADFYVNTESSSYYGKLEVVDIDSATEDYGIGFRKADKYLCYMVNKALYELQEEGKIATIAKKYGLNEVVKTFTKPEAVEDDGSFAYIQKRGALIVGYTLFAPIAYEK